MSVNSLTTGGGQTVIVQGFTGNLSFLNGSYTTASATAHHGHSFDHRS